MKDEAGAAGRAHSLDRAEQLVCLGLYVWLVARVWPAHPSAGDWPRLLLVANEGIIVAALFLRRPTARISTRPFDWAVAFAGTLAPLLVSRGGAPFEPAPGGFLMVVGMAASLGAKISLWRSFGIVAANRGVRGEGLYRLVRHPMYAGYILTDVGFLLAFPSWWNFAVYVADWSLLATRILVEERVLARDARYATYRSRVRYRLVPGLF